MTDFVPSIVEALVHAVECDLARKANQLRSLDAVISGGEEANADVVRRFHYALPWIEVVNTYGPTEASIGSVFCRLPPQPADRIPLGKPIANTFAAVIASDNGIVPRGTTGQIRSEEHTSELQSLMRISYAVFCLKKQKPYHNIKHHRRHTKR